MLEPQSHVFRRLRESKKPEALLDAIEDSAEVRFRPSQVNDLVRHVENHQEAYFDAGMAWFRNNCTESLLLALLTEMQKGVGVNIFDREKWLAGLRTVLAEAKATEEIPF